MEKMIRKSSRVLNRRNKNTMRRKDYNKRMKQVECYIMITLEKFTTGIEKCKVHLLATVTFTLTI